MDHNIRAQQDFKMMAEDRIHKKSDGPSQSSDAKSKPDQGVTDFSGHNPDGNASSLTFEELMSKYGFAFDGEEKPTRVGLELMPTLRKMFMAEAKKHDMPLSEFLRRAGFAAMKDPRILTQASVEEAEESYKGALGASRWTRSNE